MLFMGLADVLPLAGSIWSNNAVCLEWGQAGTLASRPPVDLSALSEAIQSL